MSKSRNIYIDFVKGILIFLVVFGHAIQMFVYKGDPSLWRDYIFKFIYIFHMPLFIGISGYLSYTSIKRQDPYTYIKNKIIYLFVPMLFWCIVAFCIDSLINSTMDFSQLQKIIATNYWFIWAILLYSFIVMILSYFKLDNIYLLILSAILLTALPFISLQLPLIKSMYPFFILGYIAASVKLDKIILFLKKYLIVIAILSIVFYFMWNEDMYPYITPSSFSHIKITLFRLVASTSISIAVLFALFFIYQKTQTSRIANFVANVGTETLGLYLMQQPIFFVYLPMLLAKSGYEYNYVFCGIISIIYLIIFYYIIQLVSNEKLQKVTRNVKILETIAFGKK